MSAAALSRDTSSVATTSSFPLRAATSRITCAETGKQSCRYPAECVRYKMRFGCAETDVDSTARQAVRRAIARIRFHVTPRRQVARASGLHVGLPADVATV